jgi:hypothetical protein
LIIRPFTRQDIIRLESEKIKDELCNDMDMYLPGILNGMREYTGDDVSFLHTTELQE